MSLRKKTNYVCIYNFELQNSRIKSKLFIFKYIKKVNSILRTISFSQSYDLILNQFFSFVLINCVFKMDCIKLEINAILIK